MPKLSDPRITKGHAVDSLLKLYRNDQEFVQELEEIRDPYLDLIIRCALDSFDSGRKSGLSPREFFNTVIEHAKNVQQCNPLFSEVSVYIAQLQPYFDALSKLTYRWKLRASWAAPMLVIYDMYDVLRIKGLIPEEVDMPLEEFDSLYPWASPLPALEIKIPTWAIVLQGRQKVLAAVSRKLRQYEKEIKATGLMEYPSSLQKHAKWWFEHFVHGKKYDDIAQEEIYAPGGSLISYARNVGEAVRNFSRLIGIDTRNLKGNS
jgi:deoxyadenosine/deoxycytidine kinase